MYTVLTYDSELVSTWRATNATYLLTLGLGILFSRCIVNTLACVMTNK